MHTTKAGSTTFFHDGNHDGDVIIIGPDSEDANNEVQVRVDMEDLIEFVAGAVRQRQLADFEEKLDRTTDRQILGF